MTNFDRLGAETKELGKLAKPRVMPLVELFGFWASVIFVSLLALPTLMIAVAVKPISWTEQYYVVHVIGYIPLAALVLFLTFGKITIWPGTGSRRVIGKDGGFATTIKTVIFINLAAIAVMGYVILGPSTAFRQRLEDHLLVFRILCITSGLLLMLLIAKREFFFGKMRVAPTIGYEPPVRIPAILLLLVALNLDDLARRIPYFGPRLSEFIGSDLKNPARELLNAVIYLVVTILILTEYVSRVPLHTSVTLTITLATVLAIMALLFLTARRNTGLMKLAMFAAVVITIIFFVKDYRNRHVQASTTNAASATAARKPDPDFKINLNCANAWKEVDGQQAALDEPDRMRKEGFSVEPIQKGCWGPTIILPNYFNDGWCYQPSSMDDLNDPDSKIYFKFLNSDGTVYFISGPYRWDDRPHFEHFPLRFRLQGNAHGIWFKAGHEDPQGFCISG